MTPKEWPEVMTPDQVAEFLQLNKNTVYRLIERGELKATKVGRVYRIRKEDVDSYMGQAST